jgi:hypothetical protein
MINLVINSPSNFVDNICMLCVGVDFEMPNLIIVWYIIKVDFCMQIWTPKIKIFVISVVLIIVNNIDQKLKVERITKNVFTLHIVTFKSVRPTHNCI